MDKSIDKKAVTSQLEGFLIFVREQGVIGLAIGFILGASVKQVVDSLVNDIINPFIGIILSPAGEFGAGSVTIQNQTFNYGHFITVLINFIVVAAVVYYGFKGLGLDKLDKKKDK